MTTPLAFAVAAAIVAALPATSMAETTTIDVAGGLVFEFNPGADYCKLDDSNVADWKLIHESREGFNTGTIHVIALFIPCADLAAFRTNTADPSTIGMLFVHHARNGVAKRLKGAERPSFLDAFAAAYVKDKLARDRAKPKPRTPRDDPSQDIAFESLGVLEMDESAVYFGYRMPANQREDRTTDTLSAPAL